MEETDDIIEIDKMSVDQFAGAVVLILGAIGSLLLVIWQSKCHCKVNLCYIFQCERRPPNEEELKTLADEAKTLKNKQNKMSKQSGTNVKKEEEILSKAELTLKKEDEILEEVVVTPRLIPKTDSRHQEPEPQPEVIP